MQKEPTNNLLSKDCYILSNGHLYPPNHKPSWVEKYFPGINNLPFKQKKILQLRNK